jgi:DeoR/GlpR family transcriptional regulator of sugar metabolism
VGSVAFCEAIAVSADSAVLSVGGITQHDIFAELLRDATIDGSMIAAARRTIVLADSAKFNHKLLGHIASLEQIDILVTDAEPPRELFGALEELEVQVLVAPPLNSNHRPKPRLNIFSQCLRPFGCTDYNMGLRWVVLIFPA